MIDKEVDGEQACDGRIAALLAVHLVSQVLDEAAVIANSATETGHPWHYQSMLKNLENDKLCDADDEDTSFEASKGDSDIVNENKIEHVANVVATSTPEKVTDDVQKNKLEPSFIGQGDEELDLRQNDTSTLINRLFDMSDVEKVIICDDTEIVQTNPEPNELVTEAMKNMESFVNAPLETNIETIQEPAQVEESQNPEPNELVTEAMKKMESFVNAPLETNIEPIQEPAQVEESQSVAGAKSSEKTSNSEQSEYSFLTDAYAEDIGADIALYIHDDGAGDTDRNYEVSHLVPAVKIRELPDEIPEKLVESMDVAKYENAYLTLNRDYDQNSEDEVEPILEDPKGMTLQEVELMTANTSDDNVSIGDEIKAYKKPNKQDDPKVMELTATTGVSTDPSTSKKSSLVSKCRSQGARLLACIRGWWRRRTPGRRKENRIPFAARGLCPLSPDARRRASSLLDHRMLRSPPSARAAVWKFNTVNEALVNNSSHWHEYTFDVKADECGEY